MTFHSLTHARAVRDRLLDDVRGQIPGEGLEAMLDRLCQGEGDIRSQVASLQSAASDRWEQNGCCGLPGWDHWSDLASAVEHIKTKEKEAVGGKEAQG